ncbi:uncharacterized protein METZ01_LOCUS35565 [marine metagenome]|uniref:Uncharacterized protein n=1 Tax=marine metagenome TaxID=408172 RepID=A0A381QTL6_9ZZZZ
MGQRNFYYEIKVFAGHSFTDGWDRPGELENYPG